MAQGIGGAGTPGASHGPSIEDVPSNDLQPPVGSGNGGASAGDLAELYRVYARELSDGLRYRYGDGPPDPEDVVQEAFRRVFEHRKPQEIKNVRAFLWRTARNLVMDRKRSDSRRSKLDFEVEQVFFPIRGDQISPETVIEAKAQLDLINRVLREMPDKRRTAFLLHRVDGLTLRDTGARLGISRTAVAKHIARAEAQIHALFLERRAD